MVGVDHRATGEALAGVLVGVVERLATVTAAADQALDGVAGLTDAFAGTDLDHGRLAVLVGRRQGDFGVEELFSLADGIDAAAQHGLVRFQVQFDGFLRGAHRASFLVVRVSVGLQAELGLLDASLGECGKVHEAVPANLGARDVATGDPAFDDALGDADGSGERDAVHDGHQRGSYEGDL